MALPLSFEIAPEPEQPAQPAAEGVQSIQGLRLLLVEDNDLNAEIAQTMLEDAQNILNAEAVEEDENDAELHE